MTAANPIHSAIAGSLSADDFALRSIDIYVTSSCTRRCSYCFLSDEFLGSNQHMSLDMVRSVVAWASAGSLEEITILGGEPALHPAFPEILATVTDAGLSSRTVTNGSRRFRAALSQPGVARSLTRVAVSIDAPDQKGFDALRGRGAFRDVLATVAELKHSGIPFDVNFTVLRSTVDRVVPMLAFAESLGASRLNIHWFSLVGRARIHAANETVPPEIWRDRVLSQVQCYAPSRPDFVVDCELGYAYGLPGEDLAACAVRDRQNLQFFPSGAVVACGMLAEDQGRSAYRWRRGALTPRRGESEWILTQSTCSGCPLRSEKHGYTPLCIYSRLVR